jgi:putative sigma-54 modulation protein
MEMKFFFKQMESSEALRNYAEGKIRGKVNKLSSKPVMAQVTFMVVPPKNKIHLHLHAGDGGNIEVEVLDDDMYAAVDKLIDKLDIQLRRQKEKLKGHRNVFARARKLGEYFYGPYSKLVGFGLKGQRGLAQPAVAPGTAEGADAIDASEVLKLEAARRHLFHQSSAS